MADALLSDLLADNDGPIAASEMTVSTGTSVKPPSRAWNTVGTAIEVFQGTAAAPDTSFDPTLKVSRVLRVTDAAWTGAGRFGAGLEEFGAIAGMARAEEGTDIQVTGVVGFADNASTSDAMAYLGTSSDACGILGKGIKSVNGTGCAMGGYFEGERYYDTSTFNGLQVMCRDWSSYTGGVAQAYNPGGYVSGCIWAVPGGTLDSPTGLLFGHPFGVQFEVGIAFNAQISGGKTGPVKAQSIRDDGTAVTSYMLNGTHDYGVDMRGATINNVAIALAAAHAIEWGAGNGDLGLRRSAAGVLKVTDADVGYGAIDAGQVRIAGRIVGIGCSVRKAADQVGANGNTIGKLTFDTETFDDAAFHDPAQLTRLTVPAGVTRVRIGATVSAGNVTVGSGMTLVVQKNGSAAAFDGQPTQSHNAPFALSAIACNSGPLIVVPGDYFELFLYVGDAAIDIVASQTTFWIEAC